MGFISLIKSSPLLLHAQLLHQLRQSILGGVRKPHDRLPSELELVGQIDISRATVQQALDAAEGEGLPYRVPGKGTFVEALCALFTQPNLPTALVAMKIIARYWHIEQPNRLAWRCQAMYRSSTSMISTFYTSCACRSPQ